MGSEWLDKIRKICYHTHQKFLPQEHKFRTDKHNFLPNGIEMKGPPKRLSGAQIESNAMNFGHNFKGKHPKFV